MMRKLTPEEKLKKRERRARYMTIFVNGKMKKVIRPQAIDGIPVEQFIERNADPIFLVQNDMIDQLPEFECFESTFSCEFKNSTNECRTEISKNNENIDDMPF
jgi:hypothetical protein